MNIMRSICRAKNVCMYRSNRFSLSVGENEQPDAGRDGRTHLVRPNSQAQTDGGKCSCFPIQLTTSGIGNNTRFIHTLLKVVTIHTYISRMDVFRQKNTIFTVVSVLYQHTSYLVSIY